MWIFSPADCSSFDSSWSMPDRISMTLTIQSRWFHMLSIGYLSTRFCGQFIGAEYSLCYSNYSCTFPSLLNNLFIFWNMATDQDNNLYVWVHVLRKYPYMLKSIHISLPNDECLKYDEMIFQTIKLPTSLCTCPEMVEICFLTFFV